MDTIATMMADTTTISVTRKTRDTLAALGSKDETYDDVIRRLIEGAGFKAYEKRWNQILADDDFTALEDL